MASEEFVSLCCAVQNASASLRTWQRYADEKRQALQNLREDFASREASILKDLANYQNNVDTFQKRLDEAQEKIRALLPSVPLPSTKGEIEEPETALEVQRE